MLFRIKLINNTKLSLMEKKMVDYTMRKSGVIYSLNNAHNYTDTILFIDLPAI